jgi:hypothetical protein
MILERQYIGNKKNYYKLRRDFESPTGCIRAGVIKTELEWLKQFDMDWDDCSIKSDWFEDVTPAPIPVKSLADAFKAEIQSITGRGLDLEYAKNEVKKYRNSGPEGLTVSDEDPPSESWDKRPEKKTWLWYNVTTDILWSISDISDNYDWNAEYRYTHMITHVSENDHVLRWYKENWKKRPLAKKVLTVR